MTLSDKENRADTRLHDLLHLNDLSMLRAEALLMLARVCPRQASVHASAYPHQPFPSLQNAGLSNSVPSYRRVVTVGLSTVVRVPRASILLDVI